MSHFYLTCPSIRKIKEKKIEKKININLAILPSHNKMYRERDCYLQGSGDNCEVLATQ